MSDMLWSYGNCKQLASNCWSCCCWVLFLIGESLEVWPWRRGIYWCDAATYNDTRVLLFLNYQSLSLDLRNHQLIRWCCCYSQRYAVWCSWIYWRYLFKSRSSPTTKRNNYFHSFFRCTSWLRLHSRSNCWLRPTLLLSDSFRNRTRYCVSRTLGRSTQQFKLVWYSYENFAKCIQLDSVTRARKHLSLLDGW